MVFLLVGIDTESDNQWDAAARANPTFENLYQLPRLHALFARHGIRPTYFVTHPVARDARSAAVLAALAANEGAEIGAHHHAWETPPTGPEDARGHAYASTLALSQFEAQLHSLTTAIESAVGSRPVSYRSGRFGFSAAHVEPLERAGYLVESSVTPLFVESHKGGPDFADAPAYPYFLAYDDPCAPGTSNLLEVPISCDLDRALPRPLARLWARAPRPYTTKRVLRKLGIVRPRWLRPSYSSLDDMQALARALVIRAVPHLNVIFHSSEAIAGGSPYNRTEAELAAFFERLDGFLGWCRTALGAEPVTFGEFRRRYCAVEPPANRVS